MRLITWNIQWGRGIDGRVDLARIVKTARSLADFDVLCVQEVADNFPGLEGNDDRDQFAGLGSLLPGYARIQGYGVDVEGEGGRRRRFGNAIFSRYGVVSARRHALPWPADPGKSTMPRVAVEATLQARLGAIRVTTTHLEYYSGVSRRAQAARLREIHAEACDRTAFPPAGEERDPGSPFAPKPQATRAILTGDFNFPPSEPSYAGIQRPLESGAPAYRDAWVIANGHRPHVPTFCVHDATYSKEPYCCDFVFVSADLAARVRRVEVDSATRDSDHQPVLLELDDN
jgi:endonuclease/exonuclease/phosphatase family metal-dependent hydrolase